MKITGVEAIILNTGSKRKVSDALHTYDAGGCVVTKVFTDEGITGYATTGIGRVGATCDIVKVILEKELAPLLIGEDPFFSRKIRQKLWGSADYHGVEGVAQFAIAALDTCVWDIVGKALGKPTGLVVGAHRDRIPAYAMVGWYYETEKEYVDRCVEAVEEGFRALKLKVGKYSLEDDIRRIKQIQNEVGPNIRLMVDANQAFDEVEALTRGKAYEELGMYWYEEPMIPQHKESQARLSAKLSIPLAIGENYYTRYEFYDAVRTGAASIYQPDNRRAGGLTEWLDIAAITEAAGLKLASHGGGPANVNALCAIPNAIYLESGSLKNQDNSMYVTKLKMENGEILLPDTPGMGTEVSETFIAKYRIS
ncbi:mandelate racemase/muconate lactonizing enzyme family protein [Paenibacillus cremeus]|uniref:mandelate racemase/muconate lactonizing enzyme family protein n=1 Tax=Paenibacillus cremeus TaxID=2163881 RepID=UPI0011A92023|nr:mandelate racemase/muconate lactonizing enzyme family protein [Paenibacillus cremeus]